jgi:UDP-glucose 4-epimerase
MDLVEGHLAALGWLRQQPAQPSVCETFNLGTGQGYSVMEIIRAFEQASGKAVPYRVTARRPGDIATCFADASKAEKILGWKATRSLNQMMADTWNWQSHNPQGYGQN